jgi:hypothetical protein
MAHCCPSQCGGMFRSRRKLTYAPPTAPTCCSRGSSLGCQTSRSNRARWSSCRRGNEILAAQARVYPLAQASERQRDDAAQLGMRGNIAALAVEAVDRYPLMHQHIIHQISAPRVKRPALPAGAGLPAAPEEPGPQALHCYLRPPAQWAVLAHEPPVMSRTGGRTAREPARHTRQR